MTDDLIEKIKALKGRSTASTLRTLMPEIDIKVREGVSHEDILATLYASGMDINIHTFRSTLYRYRKSQRADVETEIREEEELVPMTRLVPPSAGPEIILPPGNASDFEEALDPKNRENLGNHYLSRRKPIIRSK